MFEAPHSDARCLEPASIEEAVALLAQEWQNKRAILVGDIPPNDRLLGESTSLVSLRHLNRITEIDRVNALIVAEAGVTVGELCEATESLGWWCPALRWLPADTRVGAAVAGGHGMRTRHYGAVPDYLLGMAFVAPSVGLVRHGGKAIKNATGYNLTAMVAGSRGELGVILQVIIRLVPKPTGRRIQQLEFVDSNRAWDAARTLADVSLGAEAITLASPLNAGPSCLLLEVDAYSAESSQKIMTALSKRAVDLGGSTLDQFPWSRTAAKSVMVSRGGVDPAELKASALRCLRVGHERQLTGWLRGEATTGALELAALSGPRNTVQDILSESQVVSRAPVSPLRASLRAAFDPDCLLRTEEAPLLFPSFPDRPSPFFKG